MEIKMKNNCSECKKQLNCKILSRTFNLLTEISRPEWEFGKIIYECNRFEQTKDK